MATLSTEQVSDFQGNGFLIVRNLFDAEETGILRAAAQADSSFENHVHDIDDVDGCKANLCCGMRPGRISGVPLPAVNVLSTPWSNYSMTKCITITAR